MGYINYYSNSVKGFLNILFPKDQVVKLTSNNSCIKSKSMKKEKEVEDD